MAEARKRWPGVLPESRSTKEWASGIVLPETPYSPAPDTAKAETELRRSQDAAKDWKARATKAVDERDALQDQLDTMHRLAQAPLEPLAWTPAAPSIMGHPTVLMPLLFTSDFQCGEVIRPEEIDGLNAYNKDIFADRYAKIIDKTIDISDHHTGSNTTYPGIYYLRGGDAISGGIHEELRDTDDLSAVPAVQWLLRHEREGIKRLKDRFGRVRVLSIPGNHGRTSIKPRTKGYVSHNFETLLAWWLASTFEGDPSIEFYTPASGEAYFDLLGWSVLLAHGDRMGSKGGRGFIGTIATIARGHQKLYQNWATRGRPLDYIFTGHLHTSVQTEHGWGNGSVAGYSEFARDIGAKPDAPKQWLFYMHKRWGISQARELILDDLPKRKGAKG
jgi:hypothetical protein